ncbi:ion transporter, putative, partial [Bodo saltans]
VLTPQQRMYVHARHAIEASAIVEDEETPMPNGLSQLIHNIVTFRTQYSLLGIWKLEQPIWEYFSFLVVMTNTVAIAYTHSDMTDEENTILNNINLASLCIFTAEVVLLIVAYFPMQYFSLGWNVMDFLIVCAGWVEVGLPAAPGLTFLRVIRVSKLLRGTGVEKLILTTVRSYQSFLNALLMLILVLFIYASVGVQLFGDIPFNNILDINYNFRTLPNAMLILFQIITTEGWETTMLGCNSVGTYASYPYFISFMVLGSFVILQLFTAVVVDVFEQQTDESDRIVTEFLEIREQWLCTFGPVKAIPMQDFIQFLTKIPQDLTELSKNPQRVDIVHLLASLAIPVTSQGLVYYHHAVNALAWRRFNIEVRTIGGVIHGIVFDKVVHQSFTIGEAFCAEILQSKWRDYKMKQKLGDREYTNLVNRTRSSSVFLMPRQRSVCNIVRKDEARRMSTLSTNDDDEGYDHKMLESVDFSSGGDSAVPGRGRN